MHISIRNLSAASTAALVLTQLVGCAGSAQVPSVNLSRQADEARSAVSQTVATCDGFRLQARDKAIQQFGYYTMVDEFKRIKAEISTAQRAELADFTQSLLGVGITAEARDASTKAIQSIYGEAIDGAGFHRGTPEARDDLQRTIQASPTGTDPLSDGFTLVLSSSPKSGAAAPKVGDITDAYLASNADQSSVELIVLRVSSTASAPNGGSSLKADYIPIAQYLETRLPSFCNGVGTAMAPGQLSQLAL